MSAPAVDAPRFGTDGRIVTRERADGSIWRPGCQSFLPRARFSRSSHRTYSQECHSCGFRRRQARLARNPEAYERTLARDRELYRRVDIPRGAAIHREYLAMTQVAIERLHAIGLHYSEIARLCGMNEDVLGRLRQPNHRAQRPTMDKVLALFRVAGDVPVGRNRANHYAPHEFYAVLERRMVEPLREIAEARREGKYRGALGR